MSLTVYRFILTNIDYDDKNIITPIFKKNQIMYETPCINITYNTFHFILF